MCWNPSRALLLLWNANFNEMTTDLKRGCVLFLFFLLKKRTKRRRGEVGGATGLSYIFIAYFLAAQKCVMHEHLPSAGRQKEKPEADTVRHKIMAKRQIDWRTDRETVKEAQTLQTRGKGKGKARCGKPTRENEAKFECEQSRVRGCDYILMTFPSLFKFANLPPPPLHYSITPSPKMLQNLCN